MGIPIFLLPMIMRDGGVYYCEYGCCRRYIWCLGRWPHTQALGFQLSIQLKWMLYGTLYCAIFWFYAMSSMCAMANAPIAYYGTTSIRREEALRLLYLFSARLISFRCCCPTTRPCSHAMQLPFLVDGRRRFHYAENYVTITAMLAAGFAKEKRRFSSHTGFLRHYLS